MQVGGVALRPHRARGFTSLAEDVRGRHRQLLDPTFLIAKTLDSLDCGVHKVR